MNPFIAKIWMHAFQVQENGQQMLELIQNPALNVLVDHNQANAMYFLWEQHNLRRTANLEALGGICMNRIPYATLF